MDKKGEISDYEVRAVCTRSNEQEGQSPCIIYNIHIEPAGQLHPRQLNDRSAV